jgi:subtilisin family serine protease
MRFAMDDAPFAGRTGRGVRVAIVDSGVAPGHPHVGNTANGVSLIHGVADTLDRVGHGTAIAAAIREKAPDAELVPVKVFDRALSTDAATLARAIRWAASHDCHLVNLSLGTANTDHEGLLSEAVAFAAKEGAVVVAAFESDGTRWLPGSITGVVSVVADPTIDRHTIALDLDASRVARYSASIYPRPIPGVPPERNLHGISFAVANVTGALCRYLEDGGNRSLVGDLTARLMASGTSPSPT